MKRHLQIVESYGEYLEKQKKSYLDFIFAEFEKEKERQIEEAWETYLNENEMNEAA